MLENTDGSIENRQSSDTGNIGYKSRNKNKAKTQYVLDTTIRKQTQVTEIRHGSSYKPQEVKTMRKS